MPKILEDAVKAIKRKGGAVNPWAAATSALQKSGSLKKGSNKPTAKGVARGKMTQTQRRKTPP
jgi:hypothetical protein